MNLLLWGSWIKGTIGVGKDQKLHDKPHEESRQQDIQDSKAAITCHGLVRVLLDSSAQ